MGVPKGVAPCFCRELQPLVGVCPRDGVEEEALLIVMGGRLLAD